MKAKKQTLKPCPFCGSPMVKPMTAFDLHFITCECGLTMGYKRTPEEAQKAWNTRARKNPASKSRELNGGKIE